MPTLYPCHWRYTESSDPVTDALVQRFTGIEDHVNKLVKDSTAFRDSVQMLMSSSNDFAHSFTTVFSPIGGESSYEFENKFVRRRAGNMDTTEPVVQAG